MHVYPAWEAEMNSVPSLRKVHQQLVSWYWRKALQDTQSLGGPSQEGLLRREGASDRQLASRKKHLWFRNDWLYDRPPSDTERLVTTSVCHHVHGRQCLVCGELCEFPLTTQHLKFIAQLPVGGLKLQDQIEWGGMGWSGRHCLSLSLGQIHFYRILISSRL